ncbi:MAG: hypothetical protein K2X72_05415 [Reyranella sp.]|nr:hypothetical protein [Reyranella sp.]
MRVHILLVVILVCLPLPAGAQTEPMDCRVGPVIKTFGGSKWVVNSCADGRTVILMATNDSPAFPCFIKIDPSTEGYHIDGRGKGDRQATNAAMDELGALSVADIQAIIAETKQVQKPK